MRPSCFLFILILILWMVPAQSAVNGPPFDQEPSGERSPDTSNEKLFKAEKVAGEGVWVDPAFETLNQTEKPIRVTVWFDRQFLGDGKAYRRRAQTFADWRRTQLRTVVMRSLKSISAASFQAAQKQITTLTSDGKIRDVRKHWIVNGFSCTMSPDDREVLKSIPGVKKIFVAGRVAYPQMAEKQEAPIFEPKKDTKFDPKRYKHPWYIRDLQADRVWKEFQVAGQGTLNVIHDQNFVLSDNVTGNFYRNIKETPANDIDDDKNGLVDDYHGFDFDRQTPNLTRFPVPLKAVEPARMHGFQCAAIICGAGVPGAPYEFGIAPRATWTGVAASSQLEAAVEWAIEQGADTYSMSFSIPGLGEYRSHWRKLMEHGSFCGIFFVSGAGNFAQTVPIPVQMRTPEDIPEVVFAAAGVQRNLARTPFSSQGPVEWNTEHYQDGRIQKPEVCAFNMGLPILLRDGTVRSTGLNGNSFAGPMFCGAIALMLSADPDLLPWDLKQIITSTATDVGPTGVDFETGHGLINCYRAVKEVLRRKAVREGNDATPYSGRKANDTLDIQAIQKKLRSTKLTVARVQPGSQAHQLGIQIGDVIVKYNGNGVVNQEDLLTAKKKSEQANQETVTLEIQRGRIRIELDIKPGPLGIVPVIEYPEPTFE